LKAYISGRHTKSGRPFYSLMEMSAASGLPIYKGEEDADIIFNWGGSQYDTTAKATVLNRKPIFNKYAQSKAMINAGVATPRSYGTLREIRKFPVVRKPFNSYGGHGIVLIKDASAKEKHNVWYQEFIDKQREFRIYFFDGEIKMVEEKIVKDPRLVTWNLFNCLRWERVRSFENDKELTNLLINGAKAIRIDWGAADMLMDHNNNWWICEINSRPSCWGGQKPKRKMTVKNNIYKIEDGTRDDLDLSARMWANCMKKFIQNNE